MKNIYTMKNIHMHVNIHLLPTDNQYKGSISLTSDGRLSTNVLVIGIPHHLYITSYEEIKDGDWCLDLDTPKVFKLGNWHTNRAKKIILTTDQDLIADGVQAVDDEFLEWFVENPNCESVKVEIVEIEDYVGFAGHTSYPTFHNEYKIIIPQEEPKQETLTYTEAAKKEERIFNSTMVSKQETLEEAAERLIINPTLEDKQVFKEGAKWQAERMYSKEEVLQMYKDYEAYVIKTPITEVIEFSKWFEQFKKK